MVMEAGQPRDRRPADEQDATIAFLSRPESYGAEVDAVQRIETHCSIVFLAGAHAYKLKRAVVFSSVDYSTLARREAACRAEISLNQRTAPGLYLRACPITREPSGRLAFAGTGSVLDWVVVMRRFPQTDLFSVMAEQGRLTRPLMRALGAEIAALHRNAEITPDFGGAAGIRATLEDNHRELRRLRHLLDGAGLEELHRQSVATLEGMAALLDQRRAAGKVRRGHGDLRLANICLFEGRPTLFDSIEFSPVIGCIDVLYDLAFLLMDLLIAGRADLAATVFNSYLDHAGETAGLRALPLFLSVRAATRSYALAGGALRHPERAAAQLAAARRHLRASHEFLRPAPARLVALADPAGTSRDEAETLAALLAPPPGARVARSPLAPDAWQTARELLAAGCSVLLPGAFTAPADRQAAADLADAVQLPFTGLWRHATPAPAAWRAVPPGQAIGPAALARPPQPPAAAGPPTQA